MGVCVWGGGDSRVLRILDLVALAAFFFFLFFFFSSQDSSVGGWLWCNVLLFIVIPMVFTCGVISY
ncbi:hypothetical protein B9Z19DRAFT_578639 [Tuber borchii]|uniref:Transmembrane protein n=1 Tax=Tuber borchii TaxID=42251 RepID=A0A2T6ZC42_TUBBO|nr:hypothetical protein B9Z19DRAFT_578639 [Tuber borchii]